MLAIAQNGLKEAMLYQPQEGNRVLCQLCPHRCLIDEGKRGLCQVRENHEGRLYTLVFGRTVAQNVEAIEKKPLFHFYPGSATYSLATSGCNLHCQYCTNWEVSQIPNAQFDHNSSQALPEHIVTAALQASCRSIAYTYVEPTIFFEYLHEIASLARRSGLLNILKTNGFMTSEMLDISRAYVDAANVDLKTFRDTTYRQFGGRLQPVLNSLKCMRALGLWLEITTVIIPDLNDDPAELRDIAAFVAAELGVHTPWHVTRFFPAYKMDQVPATPIGTLHKARDIGWAAGLSHVYINNLLENGAQDTTCGHCGHVLIRRRGMRLLENRLQDNSCPDCKRLLPGVGMAT